MQIPWQKCFNFFDRSCGWQVSHDAAQPCVRIQTIGFSGFYHRVNNGTGVSAGRSITEQPGFSSDDKRANRILAAIMPTLELCRVMAARTQLTGRFLFFCRHIQRFSRKASNGSGGLYRVGTKPLGLACASALSLSRISACKYI